MKESIDSQQPGWVVDIYHPEGADRPTLNPPVRKPANDDSDDAHAITDAVARANRRGNAAR